jgi:hypothetical protein
VAFMLVHFFCLLEFKFNFEFICLESFSKYLNPIPNPYPFPAQQARPVAGLAPQPAQPRAAAQPSNWPKAPCSPAPHPPSASSRLSFRPKPAHLPPQPLPASAPCAADGWDPRVIPHLGSLPSRTRARVRPRPASPLQLGPHAKAEPLAYLRPPPPPGRASQNPSRP